MIIFLLWGKPEELLPVFLFPFRCIICFLMLKSLFMANRKTNNIQVDFNSSLIWNLMENNPSIKREAIEKLGIHPVTFYRWLDNPPTVEALISLLIALGMNWEEIAQFKIEDLYKLG